MIQRKISKFPATLRIALMLIGCSAVVVTLLFRCADKSKDDDSSSDNGSGGEPGGNDPNHTDDSIPIDPQGTAPVDLLALLRTQRQLSKEATTLYKGAQESLALFNQTIAATDTPAELTAVGQAWTEIGFELRREPRGAEVFWVVYERSDRLEGRGFFVFRKTASEPISLQIPHGESDLMTDEIGMMMCMDHPFRSCSFNTAHRLVIDLVHAPESYFLTSMEAELATDKLSSFVQLHGFDQEKRTTLVARATDVVLSNGKDKPDGAIIAAAKSLMADQPDWAIKVFGENVFELGGTKNLQAARLRALGSGKFMHIEFSKAKREVLVADAAARKDLFSAIEVNEQAER